MTSWPGNSDILVVVERGTGLVTAWGTTDSGDPVVVADMTQDALGAPAYVPPSNPTGDLAGVTGIAFHPQFTDGVRYLFIRYNESVSPPPVMIATRVVRYKIPFGKVRVDADSAVEVYSWPTVHNSGHCSGTIHFDTRAGANLLYVPMPDDAEVNASNIGTCCDMARAQGPPGASDLGRLLVLNVDGTLPDAPTVLAQGLRNPFGFSVDRGDAVTGAGLGDVWIGDTGYIETGSIIQWVPGGGTIPNYGWPWRQVDGDMQWNLQPATKAGPCQTDPAPPPGTTTGCPEPVPAPTYTAPFLGFSDIAEFGSSNLPWDALIGGYVYRGSTVTQLQNKYVFATFGTGNHGPRVYRVDPFTLPGGSAPTPDDQSTALGLSAWPSNAGIHALGQDYDGELYVVRVIDTSGQVTGNGTVFKITP